MKGVPSMAQAKRTALITGAGRNIGRACTLALARDGFNVVINGSSNRAACDAVAAEARDLGVGALVAMGDVGVSAEAKRVAAEAIARFGAVDVLVNNAAVRPNKPFLEIGEDEWQRVMAVDLDAAVVLARACLPGMLAKGWGRIINFAGMNAIHGHAGRPHVSVAKHGAWGLAKALAVEFGPKGITANIVSPGPIQGERDDPATARRIAATVAAVPVGRMGTPDEVAAAVSLLASDAGAFINGQMIQVNGGAAT
jgi:3-oxoacyl-[acyl-carrier protein] reductase